MSLTFINNDGGTLPAGAAAPTASTLLTDYTSMATEDKAAFRAAIAPAHHTVAEASDVVTLSDALPGDTAGVTDDTSYLYLLQAADWSERTNWINIITGSTAPAPS